MVTKECLAKCLKICSLYQKMKFMSDDGNVFYVVDNGDCFSIYLDGEIGCFDWDDGYALDKAVRCLNDNLSDFTNDLA